MNAESTFMNMVYYLVAYNDSKCIQSTNGMEKNKQKKNLIINSSLLNMDDQNTNF